MRMMVFQTGFTNAQATTTRPVRFYTLPFTQGLSDRGSTKTGFYNVAFMFLYVITALQLPSRSPLGEHMRRQTSEAASAAIRLPLRDRINQREPKLLLLLALRLPTLPCYVLRSPAPCTRFVCVLLG